MLKVTSQKLNIRPEDYPDLVDLSDMDKEFPHTPGMVGMPSPFPAEGNQKNQDMSATMTLHPGPDQKLTIEEIQQQVSQLDNTLTMIKQELSKLMGN